MSNKILYRYEDRKPNDILCKHQELIEYEVLSETDKSYTVRRLTNLRCNGVILYGDKKCFRKYAKNKFAHETKIDALNHYIYRKEYQKKIYEKKLDFIVRMIKLSNIAKKDLTK